MDEPDNVCQNPDTVIDKLKDVDDKTKDIMKEMMNDLKTNKYQHPTDQTGGKMKHNGGKTKNNRMRKFKKLRFSNSRQRRKQTSKKYKGGNKRLLQYAFIISIIVAAFISSYKCAPTDNTDFNEVIKFITTQFKESVINLFNIADNIKNIQAGKMNTLQAGLEVFAKMNLFNTALEKFTSYYKRLTKKSQTTIVDVIPTPISNFLDILCHLYNGTVNKQDTIKKIEEELSVTGMAKEVQESLPHSISEINEISNVSLIKDGNTMIIENVNPNQRVKIEAKIIDKRVNDPDEDDDIVFYEASETNPLHKSLNKFP
jgi:hypothetical protein